jgi:two-component system, OmpR family, sensor histidine kinase KdpD
LAVAHPAGVRSRVEWAGGPPVPLRARAIRTTVSLTTVAAITWAGRAAAVNTPTVGFVYLLLVLVLATTWGFAEAAIASCAATLAFNYFFLPPMGTLTIADPENWVALFSFLATALIGSRLSAEARRRATEAMERQQDIERLYTFSRAILLTDQETPLARQLAAKLVDVFGFRSVVLYDRRESDFARAGPDEPGTPFDDALREAALHGASPPALNGDHYITSVRLGAEPIASLALQGTRMPDSVLQGIANLVAIGLERAHAQELARQIEVARQSEQLRTTLIDAMAHELKTPLTSIKAATTALLSDPQQPLAVRAELLEAADQEADHLRELVDDAVELARLDTARIQIEPEPGTLSTAVREVLAAMRREIDDRQVEFQPDHAEPPIAFDRRLIKLAFRQLMTNALKYSPATLPITLVLNHTGEAVTLAVIDQGSGIPASELSHVFDRFYRSPSVRQLIPGSGLGLSIALGIMRAHNGNLTVTSRPGETTFRMTFPLAPGVATQ